VTFGVHDLTVAFGATVAVRAVSLEATPGSIVAVVGGDGAGKTTLLRSFVGEVRPDRGWVDRPAKEQVGYMPSSSGTWGDLTVDQNVEFVGRSYGVAAGVLRERRDRRLADAGLTDAHDRLARDLSGGMRQKLGFCLAMIHEPAMLVLDEPSTGVDPVSRVELWRMIAEAAAAGAAVLMATTYLDEAERASRVLVLDDGVALLGGAPADLLWRGSGTVVTTRTPSGRAWRRGRGYHAWAPDGPGPGEEPVTPDLEDVVIAAMLEARATAAPTGTEGP
jgi:ABC-2 type transport system ATP-binding protein